MENESCQFLVAGFRDKSIRIWIPGQDSPLIQHFDAHQAWIRFIHSCCSANAFVSVGVDGSVKKWRINGENLEKLAEIKLISPVKSISANLDNFFAICSDNKVRILEDSADGLVLAWTVKYFRGQTTAVAAVKNQLFLANKDGWLCCLDRRTWKRSSSAKMPSAAVVVRIFDGTVYCGLKNGDLAEFDLELNSLRILQIFSAKVGVLQLHILLGTIFAASAGGSVVVLQRKDLNQLFRGSSGHEIISSSTTQKALIFVTEKGVIQFWSFKQH
uniref:Uncharacterized protein n=1 Tax=Panagrolaimus sp. JU765 TaxID=591449 RepID=A0AC34Q3U0_9BILA